MKYILTNVLLIASFVLAIRGYPYDYPQEQQEQNEETLEFKDFAEFLLSQAEEQSEEDQYDVAVQAVKHNEYETLAQSVCTSMAVSKGLKGWTYAVRRVCSGSVTCNAMCASKFLHVQDPQTVDRSWKSLGALHVYKRQPSSNTNNNLHPKEGLKVYWSKSYQTRTGCGPNYCCCLAA